MTETNPKNDIFQTLARLREKYPESDDVGSIDLYNAKVKKLLAQKAYFNQEETKALIKLCRDQVIMAKKKLATDKTLVGDEKAHRELWFLIESRSWFLDMVSEDIDTELSSIQQELEMELDR